MSEMRNFPGKGRRVLFFGRAKCSSTEDLLKKLVRYGFDVTFVKSRNRGEKLPEDIYWWEGEYILCFRSLFVLPIRLIDKASIAAINFHPAPPEYSGSGCINFALYDEVSEYGVTCHVMNELVDNGKILEVRRFPVTPFDDLPTVLTRTHSELFNLCSDFISGMYSGGENFLKEKIDASEAEVWKGNARLLKELDALQKIDTKVSEKELKRIIRATYIEGYPPRIELHGFTFRLELED
ncbi:formyltransferase family protein [Burkholderiales bacterium]|nr:formyltransferase family protein [Burkholderiales bacterium]